MPSQLLHTLFGEDVIIEINRRVEGRTGMDPVNALGKIPETHKKVFALGCQGPDIFYHSQRRRPVGLEYGTLLHRRGAGTFTAGLLKLGLPAFHAETVIGREAAPPLPEKKQAPRDRRRKRINVLGAYALGFMTHAILDRLAHPYIVYKSDRPPPETSRRDRSHAFFERIIDTLMFRHLRGAEISEWDQNGLLAEVCENPPLGLKELLARALVQAFPERAGKDEKLVLRVENTFLDCEWFYRRTAPGLIDPEIFAELSLGSGAAQTDNRQKGFVAYLYPENLPSKIDFLNLEKRPWYHPAGEEKEDHRSFPEIYTEAVNAAADSLTGIIARYYEEGAFPIEEAVWAIGNGGLSIVDENGKPCAPLRSSPLPLQEVLDGQIALRGLNN